MNILDMSIICSIFILFIILIRALFLYKIRKYTFVILWLIVMIRLILPIRIESPINVFVLLDNIVEKEQGLIEQPTSEMIPKTILVEKINDTGHNVLYTRRYPLQIIYYTIGILIGLRFFVLYIKTYRKLREAIPIKDNVFINALINKFRLRRKVSVLYYDRIQSPITYGVIRPKILLPKSLDLSNLQQLNYIITHEMVHIKRYDMILNHLSHLCVCLHWFNPLVWIMYLLFDKDREIACDEKVLSLLGENEKAYYAKSLIEFASLEERVCFMNHNYSRNNIKERIVSVMKFKKSTLYTSILAGVLIIGSTLVFASEKPSSKEVACGNFYMTNEELTEERVKELRDKYGNDLIILTEKDQVQKIDREEYTVQEYEKEVAAFKSEENQNRYISWYIEKYNATKAEATDNFQKIADKMTSDLEKLRRGTLLIYKPSTSLLKDKQGNPIYDEEGMHQYVSIGGSMDLEQLQFTSTVGDTVFGPYSYIEKDKMKKDIQSYLDDQVTKGIITQEEADELYENRHNECSQ